MPLNSHTYSIFINNYQANKSTECSLDYGNEARLQATMHIVPTVICSTDI